MQNPVLMDVPDQLETERLVLRCPAAGDGRALHQSIVSSIAALRQFPASMPWAVTDLSGDTVELYCRQSRAKYLLRSDLPMLLFLKADGLHVGSTGLHRIDWSVPKCEIGFWIHSDFVGQGLVSEAVQAIAALGFDRLGMRRIQAVIDEENHRSIRVCERAGFELEGRLRHAQVTPDGALRTTRIYALVR